MNIEKLTDGQLDNAIAKTVMGWGEDFVAAGFTPSIAIGPAFEVVDKMVADGYGFVLGHGSKLTPPKVGWTAKFMHPENVKLSGFSTENETKTRAIALAALDALSEG